MGESDRVQRWREAKRQQGLEPLTIWVSHEDKARLIDMAQRWHRSPSTMIREALAQFDPVSVRATATETDAEQLRTLIRDELVASSIITAMVADTVADTVPALVRQIVEELALEALGLPATATYSDVADIEASEDTPVVRKAGRPRGEMHQRIVNLLADHPEGLSAEAIRAYLKPKQPLGDTLQGMRRQQVVRTQGSGRDMVYFLA